MAKGTLVGNLCLCGAVRIGGPGLRQIQLPVHQRRAAAGGIGGDYADLASSPCGLPCRSTAAAPRPRPCPGRSRMPSVIALLEQRALRARRRVDELREEADRVQGELAVAAREWKEWTIARSRVGEVPAPADEPVQDYARPDRPRRPPGSGRDRPRRCRRRGRRSRSCRYGERGWAGRFCRWITSAFSRRSLTGPGSVKGP